MAITKQFSTGGSALQVFYLANVLVHDEDPAVVRFGISGENEKTEALRIVGFGGSEDCLAIIKDNLEFAPMHPCFQFIVIVVLGMACEVLDEENGFHCAQLYVLPGGLRRVFFGKKAEAIARRGEIEDIPSQALPVQAADDHLARATESGWGCCHVRSNRNARIF